jgi:hypothetical protein
MKQMRRKKLTPKHGPEFPDEGDHPIVCGFCAAHLEPCRMTIKNPDGSSFKIWVWGENMTSMSVSEVCEKSIFKIHLPMIPGSDQLS